MSPSSRDFGTYLKVGSANGVLKLLQSAWQQPQLKKSLRTGVVTLLQSPWLRQRLKNAISLAESSAESPPAPQAAAALKPLNTLEEVDAFLAGMLPEFTERDLRAYWDGHRGNRAALFGTPADSNPYSAAFKDQVVREYITLSGRQVNAYDNERTLSIDFKRHIARPFPYDMKRPSVAVSNMLFTFARIFSLVNFEEGQRLIEFGSGWGNASTQFAQAGLKVSLVDIEENFLALSKERLSRLGLGVDCHHGEFNDVELVPGQFDYAFFMSSFHHCMEHAELLRRLHGALSDSGKIIFCVEPITNDFDVPWGIRLDGESVWAIRRNGWLELGFQERYFRECLMFAGFLARKHTFSNEKGETIWVAEKARPRDFFFEYAASFGGEPDQFYVPEVAGENRIVFTRREKCQVPVPAFGAGMGLELGLINYLPREIRVAVSTPAFNFERRLHAGESVDLDIPAAPAGATVDIETELHMPANDRRNLGVAIRKLDCVPRQ